jgi:hypothetical protein
VLAGFRAPETHEPPRGELRLLLRKTGRKTRLARQIETRRRTAIPGEAKMIDSPFHRTQNGVFSIQEERIDRSSGECGQVAHYDD